jgi:hypothetical protein
MFLVYWIGKKIFNPYIALIALFLTAISRPVFSQSTVIWNPNLLPSLVILVIWFLYEYFRERKEIFMAIVYFLIALMYHFELTVVASFLVYTSIFLLILNRKEKVRIRNFFFVFLSLLLGFLPALLFELRHNFLQTKSFLNFFLHEREGRFYVNWEVQLDHLKSFWFNLLSTFNLPSFAIKPFILCTFLIGIVLFLKNKNYLNKPQKQLLLYFIFFPFVNFSLYFFFPNAVWQWYLTHLYFIYIFLASVIVYFSMKNFKFAKVIYLIFFIFALYSSLKTLESRYRYDFFDTRGTAGFKSKLAAIDYIYQNAEKKEFNILVFTPPVYDYAYRYLLWWYGGKKYNYVPGDKKEGLLYLWIEPDNSKPWTYKGWLETEIRVGKILNEIKLPSGFIIQKRYVEEN